MRNLKFRYLKFRQGTQIQNCFSTSNPKLFFSAVLNFARAAPESAAPAKQKLRHFKFGWGGKIIAGRNYSRRILCLGLLELVACVETSRYCLLDDALGMCSMTL